MDPGCCGLLATPSFGRGRRAAAIVGAALLVGVPGAQARELGARDLVSSGRVVAEGREVGGPIAAVGDVDGDGSIDLAVAAPEPTRARRAPARAATVLLSGGGRFTIRPGAETTDRSGPITVAAAGDVNGDGLATSCSPTRGRAPPRCVARRARGQASTGPRSWCSGAGLPAMSTSSASAPAASSWAASRTRRRPARATSTGRAGGSRRRDQPR